MMHPVYIIDAMRTPVGKGGGVFAHTRSDDLCATLIKEMLRRHSKLDPETIDDVVLGCALPESEQAFNVARVCALLGGLPQSVPAMTVNRLCSSGLQAIALAADRIASGQAKLMLAGGLESMSMVPMIGNKPAFNPKLFEDEDVAIAYGMGITAENVAIKYKVGREEQDVYALESHQRACRAIDAGHFKSEILPIKVRRRFLKNGRASTGDTIVAHDEGPRRDTSAEALAKLRPAFAKNGTVTAGSSSQISDGAGLALLADEETAKRFGDPLARFVGYAVAGVPPAIMGIGPIEAIPRALKKTDLAIKDMAWIELNEAFAAQTLAVINELKLDKEIVNPLGGAIALGHPLGATGAIRTATLVHNLKNNKLRYGMVTMCIGTGMGAAGIFERV